jgi:hypothetical protein
MKVIIEMLLVLLFHNYIYAQVLLEGNKIQLENGETYTVIDIKTLLDNGFAVLKFFGNDKSKFMNEHIAVLGSMFNCNGGRSINNFYFEERFRSLMMPKGNWYTEMKVINVDDALSPEESEKCNKYRLENNIPSDSEYRRMHFVVFGKVEYHYLKAVIFSRHINVIKAEKIIFANNHGSWSGEFLRSSYDIAQYILGIYINSKVKKFVR